MSFSTQRSHRSSIRHHLVLRLFVASAIVASVVGAADGPVGVGDPLPDFTVVDESGVPTYSGAFAGKVLLVDFWASWCYPCRFTLPELDRVHDEFGDRDDFAVVGLSLDRSTSRRKAKLMASTLGYVTYYDTGSKPLAPQLGVEGLPVLFLVDTDGRILRRWDGEPDFDEVRAALIETLGADAASAPETAETSEP